MRAGRSSTSGAGIVGRDWIKPDVFYTLVDGHPVEMKAAE